MELNGEDSNFEQKIYAIPYYIFKNFNVWSKSQGPKKNVSIFQEEGFTPATPMPLVIRVVLLHVEHFVQSFNSSTVCNGK